MILPFVFIYKFYKKEIQIQENLKNNIVVKFDKKYWFEIQWIFKLYFYFVKKITLNPTTRRTSRTLVDVLQGMLKYYIILFDIFLGGGGGSGFHNPNYLEIKKDLISKFLAPMIQNILIGNFQLQIARFTGSYLFSRVPWCKDQYLNLLYKARAWSSWWITWSSPPRASAGCCRVVPESLLQAHHYILALSWGAIGTYLKLSLQSAGSCRVVLRTRHRTGRKRTEISLG